MAKGPQMCLPVMCVFWILANRGKPLSPFLEGGETWETVPGLVLNLKRCLESSEGSQAQSWKGVGRGSRLIDALYQITPTPSLAGRHRPRWAPILTGWSGHPKPVHHKSISSCSFHSLFICLLGSHQPSWDQTQNQRLASQSLAAIPGLKLVSPDGLIFPLFVCSSAKDSPHYPHNLFVWEDTRTVQVNKTNAVF